MAVPLDLDIEDIIEAATSSEHNKPGQFATLPEHTSNGGIEMTTVALPKNPLAGFEQLGTLVHRYTPPTPPPEDSTDPGLIIICSWAFAQPRHISKYLKGYQNVYANSQILLVQVAINNMLFRPDSWQMSMMFNTAAQAVKDYVDSVAPVTPRILLQNYSNGGSHSSVQLAEAYKARYGTDLPISAFVLDSTPGVPRWFETASALQTGFPKSIFAQALGALAIHSVLAATTVMHYTGISELATVKLFRTLNEPNGAFLKATIPRTYIHSREDVMILTRDVEAHADTARSTLMEKGAAGDIIKVEEFVGTAHANHMSGDPERYWRIVQDTWAKSQP